MRELSKAEEIARGLQLLVDRCERVDVLLVESFVAVEVKPFVNPDGERCPQRTEWLVRAYPSLHEHHVQRLFELGWQAEELGQWLYEVRA